MDTSHAEEGGITLDGTIQTLNNLLETVRITPRELLPEEIQTKINHVDSIVEEFVNGQSVATWSNETALEMLEKWDELRNDFEPWSQDKENKLLEHEEEVKNKEKILHDSKKELEHLEQKEIDIRRQMNQEIQTRADLDSRRQRIDEEIEKLTQQREEIVASFEMSRENSSKFAENLEEVLSELENSDGGIQRMEVIVEELASDQTLNAEKEQHDQFVHWKSKVEAVMNEIQQARELDWKTWSPQEIVDWICRLSKGTFKVYKERLEQEIPAQMETGVDLLFLLRDRQLIRELGVTKIRHRDLLIQHIERLERRSPSKNKVSIKGTTPNV